MQKQTDIPQHDLLNAAGKPVSIHYETWGTVARYSTQTAHRHNFHEILFFETGGGVHDIDFTTWDVAAGGVHFVSGEGVHLLARDVHTRGCSLMFTQDVVTADLLLRLPFARARPVLHLAAEQMQVVHGMLNIIATLTEAEAAYPVLRAQLQTLLLYLAGICGDAPEAGQGALPPLVVNFRQLVQQQYKLHVNVSGYAGQLHVSAKHLIDVCRTHTGKTPLQLIREYTVAEAKRLLYNTGMTVKEVAYALNFDDPAAFSKYFKSVCGYSPAGYRKEGK